MRLKIVLLFCSLSVVARAEHLILSQSDAPRFVPKEHTFDTNDIDLVDGKGTLLHHFEMWGLYDHDTAILIAELNSKLRIAGKDGDIALDIDDIRRQTSLAAYHYLHDFKNSVVSRKALDAENAARTTMTQAREILGIKKPIGQSDSDYIVWADRVKADRVKADRVQADRVQADQVMKLQSENLRQIEDLKASAKIETQEGIRHANEYIKKCTPSDGTNSPEIDLSHQDGLRINDHYVSGDNIHFGASHHSQNPITHSFRALVTSNGRVLTAGLSKVSETKGLGETYNIAIPKGIPAGKYSIILCHKDNQQTYRGSKFDFYLDGKSDSPPNTTLKIPATIR